MLLSTVLWGGCNDADDRTVHGQWKLMAQLVDPGDGSGEFIAVESDKVLTLYSDSTFESNGPMCQMGSGTSISSSGTWSEIDMTITPIGCGSDPMPIHFVMEDDLLIVSFPCIEACKEMFERVE
jgi:hypothetical protein